MLFVVFCLTTAGGALLATPLLTRLLFRDARSWRYWNHLIQLYPLAGRLARRFLTDSAYRQAFPLPWTEPPKQQPDNPDIRLAATWSFAQDTCGSCNRCCSRLACPLLDAGRCLSYGSFYWQYYNCGRYPQTAKQVAYYRCPKWTGAASAPSSGKTDAPSAH